MFSITTGKKHITSFWNTRIKGVLKLCVGIVLIALFIRQIQWVAFIETISSTYVPLMIAGIALSFVNMFIAAWRWYVLLNALNAKIPFLKVVKILFICLFFNTFLPGGFAGDIVRSLQSRGDNLSTEDALSSVFTDRILGFIGLVFLSILGVLCKWDLLEHSGLLGYIILICSVLIVLIGMFYNRRIMRNFRFIVTVFGRWGEKIENLYRSLYQYRHKLKSLVASFGITIVSHLMMFASVYCLALSLGVRISFIYFVLFLPIIGTLSMVPVTVGGLGLREFGFMLLFPLVGMTKAQALGTSLFFFMTMVLVALTGAFIYVSETIAALLVKQTA
jgi:uncharacterized protein (TIRG00374 family)